LKEDSRSNVNPRPSNGLGEFIDHAEAYVRGNVHTNGLENFWSLLKRSLKGAYVSVEPFHLQAYCNEQAFRLNNRKAMDDFGRFKLAMSQIVGKRLTWDELTGKQMEPGPSLSRRNGSMIISAGYSLPLEFLLSSS
jgi:ISXO2-like transposase domain